MINLIFVYVLSFLSFLLVLFILACVMSILFSVTSFAPWVPSRGRDLKRIFKLAGLKSGQTFYDLGCGDGKIVFYAAKNYKAKAIGLEISLPLYLLCKVKQLFNRDKNIKFKFRNLHKENLGSADVVYFFSIPHSLNEKFSVKLKKELKPGAKVISYSFKLADWTPSLINKQGEKDLPVYLYEV